MYQFSLACFIKLFGTALRDDSIEASMPLEERLSKLTPLLERLVFFFVGRGLFKADRCMFALHLVHGMHGEHFQPKEWELFTGELAGEEGGGDRPRGFPDWAGSDRASTFSVMNAHLGTPVSYTHLTLPTIYSV